jgi:hypothetical protein
MEVPKEVLQLHHFYMTVVRPKEEAKFTAETGGKLGFHIKDKDGKEIPWPGVENVAKGGDGAKPDNNNK